ncbi:MAG TPA: glycosyltransferase, partial [Candidatus Paceibacterota bacterium]|nr:glycosyltransferase [Candidatus Paceibacterota bacterium]
TVTVVFGEEGILSARLADAGIPTVRIKELGRDLHLTNDWTAYRRLRALFSRERPDVVHINSSKAGGLGALAARAAGVPTIIFTAHGWAFNESRPWWQRALIWNLAGLTVLLSHKTICVSEAVRRDIKNFPFIRRKLTVVKNGVSCPLQLPREKAREELLPGYGNTYWVGMVSELHETKRVDDAVRAFVKIKDEFSDAILVVAGEGEERARLEKLVSKLGAAGRIFFLGFVHGIDTKLSAFDAFIHTSRSEALALAVLEAGCAALPTIATRVGGIPEIIDDGATGFLVPPFRPDAVAEKLRTLFRDPARARELGAALRARIRRDFTKERMTRETLALYR